MQQTTRRCLTRWIKLLQNSKYQLAICRTPHKYDEWNTKLSKIQPNFKNLKLKEEKFKN